MYKVLLHEYEQKFSGSVYH